MCVELECSVSRSEVVPSLEFVRIVLDHDLRHVDLLHKTDLPGFNNSASVDSSFAVRIDNCPIWYNFAGGYLGPGTDRTVLAHQHVASGEQEGEPAYLAYSCTATNFTPNLDDGAFADLRPTCFDDGAGLYHHVVPYSKASRLCSLRRLRLGPKIAALVNNTSPANQDAPVG